MVGGVGRGQPAGERVDVGDRREVRRQHVQLGARPRRRRYSSRYQRRRAGVSVEVATTTVAPPRSSRRTSSAAIDPGLAPVTSAVSPLQVGLLCERRAQAGGKLARRRLPRASRGDRAGDLRRARRRPRCGRRLRPRRRGAGPWRRVPPAPLAFVRNLGERLGELLLAVVGGAAASDTAPVSRARGRRRGARCGAARRGRARRATRVVGGDEIHRALAQHDAKRTWRRWSKRGAISCARSRPSSASRTASRAASPSSLAPRRAAFVLMRLPESGEQRAAPVRERLLDPAGTRGEEAVGGAAAAGTAPVSGRPSASPVSSAARSTSGAALLGRGAGSRRGARAGPAGGRAIARLERQERQRVIGQPRSEVPGGCEARRGVGAGQARAPERAREARGDRVAQVGARKAVVGRLLAHRRHDLAERLARGRLRARQSELAAEVDQHLVAPRRRALKEVVERLVVVELVRAHTGLDGEHEPQRGAGVDRAVGDGTARLARRVDLDGGVRRRGTWHRRIRRSLWPAAPLAASWLGERHRRRARPLARAAPLRGRPPASSTAARSSSACSSAGGGPARSSDSSVVRIGR